MANQTKAEDRKTAAAPPETTETALEVAGSAALEGSGIDMDLEPAPEWVPATREGLESITKKDMLIPRIALAQPLSPQVTEGDTRYIEGLKPGDLFNSVTGKIYGRGVAFQVVRKDEERAMEFYDMDDGGGVADPDVPLNDPRCKWGADGEKPRATRFLDFLVIVQHYGQPTIVNPGTKAQKTVIAEKDRTPGGRELVALSFKSSGIKVAKKLNGLLAFRSPAPMYAGRFLMTTGQELVPKPHKVYLVTNDNWVDKEEGAYGKRMFEAVKGFDTARGIDRTGHQSPETEGAPAGADGIPF